MDKATTYRYLQSLEAVGFVEQNPITRQYRLGPAVMHLAHIRELTVPRSEAARPVLAALAESTGETAHATVLSGTTLYGLCACESPRHGIRAVIDISVFPLHATASGLCALAFGRAELMEAALVNLEGFTDTTPTSEAELTSLVEAARETGFARASRSYEAEILGLAAPVFDQTGELAGAVAVASVASRLTTDLEQRIVSELVEAARDISRNWGGTIPQSIETAWATSVASRQTWEPTT